MDDEIKPRVIAEFEIVIRADFSKNNKKPGAKLISIIVRDKF
jgi:hypothetical protein